MSLRAKFQTVSIVVWIRKKIRIYLYENRFTFRKVVLFFS